MSRISYRLTSVELIDSVIRSFTKDNLVRINLPQKPSKITEEFLLNNVKALENINHEFIINDPSNKLEKISMTIRKVIKKPTLASFFNLDNNAPKKKSNDHTVDRYIGGNRENRDNNVVCEYITPIQSLIGYCVIDLKEIEKGINNSIRTELISRVNDKVVGYVNLELYIWNSPSKILTKQKIENINDDTIVFIDPDYPSANTSSVVNQLRFQSEMKY